MSEVVHAPLDTVSVGVVTVEAQLVYDAGHVVTVWHTRGVVVMSHVSLVAVQSVHETPPEPHCVSRKPAKHVPVRQQPGHVINVQGEAHTPLVHASLIAVQSAHARPSSPHCVSGSFVTHASPAQHPVGQLLGVHNVSTVPQLPVDGLQYSPWTVQSVHARPPSPHSASLGLPTHAPPEQHVEHVLGPHGALTHACELPSQASPIIVQLVHAAAPVPHARDDRPDTQAG